MRAKSMEMCGSEYLYPILSGRLSVPIVVDDNCSYYKEIVSPIDDCDEICKTMPTGYELYIKSKLFQFFFALHTRCGGADIKNDNRKNFERVKPILKYVEEHFADKITIAEIASVAGFSESYIMRFFKETMRISFVEFLKDYRLAKAYERLQSSKDNILEVAESVGFDNLSYFNRSFKAKYKITPGQCRGTGNNSN